MSVLTKNFAVSWQLLTVGLLLVAWHPHVFANDNNDQGYSWESAGLDIGNTSNASKISGINSKNVNKLKIKWIHNNGFALPNPPTDPRSENGVSAMAVDKQGRLYVTLYDGRIVVINSNTVVNGAPVVLKEIDVRSPQYTIPTYNGDPIDREGDDITNNRIPPSIIGDRIYMGKYTSDAGSPRPGESSAQYADSALGVSHTDNPTLVSDGAVLYSIDRFTGQLKWKSLILGNNIPGLPPFSNRTSLSMTGVTELDKDTILVGFSTLLTGHFGFFFLLEFLPFDPFQGACCDFNTGGVVALDKQTGATKWITFTLPTHERPSYVDIFTQGRISDWTGGSVWGAGQLPISRKNKLVYAGSGEAAGAPYAAELCEFNRLGTDPITGLATGDLSNFSEDCLRVNKDGSKNLGEFGQDQILNTSPRINAPLNALSSSVIAMDVNTGKIKWARALSGYDVWNASCFAPLFEIFAGIPAFVLNFPTMCPDHLRPPVHNFQQFTTKDLDVAEQPMLVENVAIDVPNFKGKTDIIVATTKGAKVYAFKADDGTFLWKNSDFGDGGLSGQGDGFIFGSSVDNMRFYSSTGKSSNVYTADLDNPANPKKVVINSCPRLPNGNFISEDPFTNPNGVQKWEGAMHVAVNLKNGTTAWQRCSTGTLLNNSVDRQPIPGSIIPGRAQAPVSVVNDVVVVPGASDAAVPLSVVDDPFSEVLLLKADTGALLRKLPLSLPGAPSATTIVYARPIIVGNRIYIGTGARRGNGCTTEEDAMGPNPCDSDPAGSNDELNRVIMYEINENEQ